MPSHKRFYIHGTKTGEYKIGTGRTRKSSSKQNEKNSTEGLEDKVENVFQKENGKPKKIRVSIQKANSLIPERESEWEEIKAINQEKCSALKKGAQSVGKTLDKNKLKRTSLHWVFWISQKIFQPAKKTLSHIKASTITLADGRRKSKAVPQLSRRYEGRMNKALPDIQVLTTLALMQLFPGNSLRKCCIKTRG